ncbi:hypothetical protein GCM10027290_30970 [Micromonospora sonneratiae]
MLRWCGTSLLPQETGLWRPAQILFLGSVGSGRREAAGGKTYRRSVHKPPVYPPKTPAKR